RPGSSRARARLPCPHGRNHQGGAGRGEFDPAAIVREGKRAGGAPKHMQKLRGILRLAQNLASGRLAGTYVKWRRSNLGRQIGPDGLADWRTQRDLPYILEERDGDG